jgi:hypothetical protein
LSFASVLFKRKLGIGSYLENCKIIAKLINESSREIKAFWFFTPYTIPDKELLNLLDSGKHEIALHVANHPFAEWKCLEEKTGRKVRFYTVHGTERLLGKLLWRRQLHKNKADIPDNFPLQSFYVYPTFSLDVACYAFSENNVFEKAKVAYLNGEVVHFHPEWLFNRGLFNHRGPVYNTLMKLLSCF